mgnify:CR=1 FL=1
MKISELEAGAVCYVPGIDLELEVLGHSASSTRVRPTKTTEVVFMVHRGTEKRVLVRTGSFHVSREIDVEVRP